MKSGPANAAAIANLKANAILGTYRRRPVENDWHTGEIHMSKNGGMMWTNKAGASWKVQLQPKTGMLVTGMDNPYFKDFPAKQRDFRLSRRYGPK